MYLLKIFEAGFQSISTTFAFRYVLAKTKVANLAPIVVKGELDKTKVRFVFICLQTLT